MKVITTLLIACATAATAGTLSLVPRPVSLKPADGNFRFSGKTTIRYADGLKTEAEIFAADLAKTGVAKPQVVPAGKNAAGPTITLALDPSVGTAASAYRLKVAPDGIAITGRDKAGVFHGTRTLLQMFPAKNSGDSAELAAVEITDQPRFQWRGMHLDVGRHMFAVEDIKKYIDWLAFHKLNVFHWHLTEDQGWRIEIKKWPKLTEVGAWRESTPPYGNRNGSDGKRYGGFYTQEQAKEIVAYAAARHVTVVPEIDMPGHMAAAVTAYPELGNNDIPGFNPKVATKWGVFEDTLAPTEKTFQFVDDVFTEICAIFPSAYIHMGGDEAPKKQWNNSPQVKELMKKENLKDSHEVQSYFVKRVEKILESKGRKLIGWDEIREGGLSPKATVMSWRGENGGIASAKEGHDVVMSANGFLYFDYYQESAADALAKGIEHETIGGFVPISKVYGFDPVPGVLNEAQAKHIIGVQGQSWTEYMKTYDKVEYQVFPRIAALSEIAWSPKEGKNYADFVKRMENIMSFYDAAGVNHGPIYAEPKREAKDGATVSTTVGFYQKNWPELAFDGKADTQFWSDRGLNENDAVAVTLKSPLENAASVKVATGKKNGSDKLEIGVLEVSADGSAWTEIGKFSGGKAEGKAPAGTKAVRLRATAAQETWLTVPEIVVE
ncbi:MAG: beta-N-acetylhexosaminidase [Verrucomicrobiota bacterium]